jgi:hypothetical protein
MEAKDGDVEVPLAEGSSFFAKTVRIPDRILNCTVTAQKVEIGVARGDNTVVLRLPDVSGYEAEIESFGKELEEKRKMAAQLEKDIQTNSANQVKILKNYPDLVQYGKLKSEAEAAKKAGEEFPPEKQSRLLRFEASYSQHIQVFGQLSTKRKRLTSERDGIVAEMPEIEKRIAEATEKKAQILSSVSCEIASVVDGKTVVELELRELEDGKNRRVKIFSVESGNVSYRFELPKSQK